MAIKYRVRVMKDINGQLTEVAFKRVNARTGMFRYKEGRYHLDMTINISRRKSEVVYGYCVNRGQLVSIANIIPTNPDQKGRQVVYKGIEYSQTYDEMTNDKSALQKVFAGLTSQVSKSGIFDASIIGLLLCIALGVFAGIFIGGYI